MTDYRPSNQPQNDAQVDRDPALASALREWRAPTVPDSLDARVLSSYRKLVKADPWWRRFFTMSVRVPLPVAVATLALLLVSALLALRRPALVAPPLPEVAVQGSLQAAKVEPPVVIRTSLAGFEPAAEVSVSVMREPRP